jgi:XRE family transcriptional regulator, regulator of sulfur utilization
MARSLQRALGEELRELRKQRGFSQELLADKADLHRNFIGLVERGQRNVTLTTLEMLAAALRMSVSELIARTERRAGR